MPSVANLLEINWKMCNRETTLWVEIIKCVDFSLSVIQKQGTGLVYVEALLYLTHIIGHFLWMSLLEGIANLILICQRGYYVDSCEVCQSLITVGIPLEHCVFLYDTY
jgi:hypothetical protein